MPPVESSEICLLAFSPRWYTCMQKGEWASWIQAIGALVAIAAAFAVVRWQISEQARVVSVKVERKSRADEIAALDRALLLLDWYANAAQQFALMFNGPLSTSQLAQFWLPGNPVLIPAYLDAMALSFLVQRNAQKMHTSFEVVALTFAAFESAARARSELMTSDVVRSRLFAEHEQTGQLPMPDTGERVLGAPLFSQIVNATAMVAKTSAEAHSTIQRESALIREGLAHCCPKVTFAQP